MFNKQCRTINPNLNAIGMWTKGFAGRGRSLTPGRVSRTLKLIIMHEVIDSLPPAGQKHTHTYIRMNHLNVCVCVWVKATCGTETEIYADMKTLPLASVRRSIRRSRRRRKSLSGARPIGIAVALAIPKLVVIQCSIRNLMELTFVSHLGVANALNLFWHH